MNGGLAIGIVVAAAESVVSKPAELFSGALTIDRPWRHGGPLSIVLVNGGVAYSLHVCLFGVLGFNGNASNQGQGGLSRVRGALQG